MKSIRQKIPATTRSNSSGAGRVSWGLAILLSGCASGAMAQNAAPAVQVMYSIGGTGASAANGSFSAPLDVGVLANGNIVVADTGNNRIQTLDSAGNFISSFAITAPQGVQVLPNNNLVVSSGTGGNSTVQVLTSGGVIVNTLSRVNPFGQQLNFPNAIGALATGPQGNIYFADQTYNLVMIYDSTGKYVSQFRPSGLATISSVNTGPDGTLAVADNNSSRIILYTASGVPTGIAFGSLGTGPGQFQSIGGVEIFSNGVIAVSDLVQNNIQFFSAGGVFLTTVGSTGSGLMQFSNIGEIRSSLAGNIIAVDTGNNRVTVVQAVQSGTVAPYTDLWWSPQLPGAGYAIEVNPITGNLLFGAYDYGADGRATWCYATLVRNGATFTGNLIQQSNGSTLVATTTSPSLKRDVVGTISVSFASARSATITWPASLNTPMTSIVSFSIGSPFITSTSQQGWYNDLATTDREVFVSALGSSSNIVVSYGRSDGSAVWSYGGGFFTTATAFFGNLSEYSAGPSYNLPGRGPISTVANIGTSTFVTNGLFAGTLTIGNIAGMSLARRAF